jgi:hypothetical protein
MEKMFSFKQVKREQLVFLVISFLLSLFFLVSATFYLKSKNESFLGETGATGATGATGIFCNVMNQDIDIHCFFFLFQNSRCYGGNRCNWINRFICFFKV